MSSINAYCIVRERYEVSIQRPHNHANDRCVSVEALNHYSRSWERFIDR